ncbi:MobA/MobL family protein [bacterium SCSIO 12827]|nr:MobA/MobL family protein [bacterium SCSIO 12827]
MARNPFLFDAVFEDDLERIKMGRFNEAEEHMMEQIIRGRGAKLWRVFGRGRHYADMRRPGLFSSRPRTAEGGHTFIFSHKTVSKRYRPDLRLGERLYLRVDEKGRGPELRAAGAKYDKRVSVAGHRGAWWVPVGTPAPRDTTFARVSHLVTEASGERPGTAARRQKYIERDEAVEIAEHDGTRSSVGNIAKIFDEREVFWDMVERRERADGRVQGVIIAELPYEPEIGADGRRRIVEAFGGVLADLGLRWHGTVHRPDDHSDPRNFHMHLVYCERPAEPTVFGWRFADRKAPETRKMGFLPMLRQRFADAVNAELEAAGMRRRYDPRSYEKMGIDKQPGVHLGVSAAALERKGVVTVKGRRNVTAEMMFRLAGEVVAARDGIAEDLRRLVGPVELAARASASLSPRVGQAAREMARAAEQYVDAAIEHRRCEANAVITSHRANDVLRRPESTAEYNDDDGLRAEAKAIAADLRAWGQSERTRASREFREAKRRRAKSEKAVILAEQKLRGELLLAERGRVLTGLDVTLRKLTDGRLSEREWRRQGAEYIVRRDTAERLREDARIDILSALEPLGAKVAASRLCDMEHGLRRADAVKRLRGDEGLSVDQVRRAETAAVDLERSAAELAAVEGEERRRRRVEADEELRRRRIRSDAEDRELRATLRVLRRELSDIDRRIISDPAALAMAGAEGMADRIGRESQAIKNMLRAADTSDGIRKHQIHSPDFIGGENHQSARNAQNAMHTAKDESSSTSSDTSPSLDQSDPSMAEEERGRKRRPWKPRKPDRSR